MTSPDPEAALAPTDAAVSRSEGLLLAPFLDGAVVYDQVTETVHRLSATAAWLLDQAPARVADLVARAVAATGGPRDRIEHDIGQGLALLRAQGLVDRDELVWSAAPAGGSGHDRPGWTTGRTHAVIDHRLAFRSPDPALVALVDTFLGPGTTDDDPGLFFDLAEQPDGAVDLHTDTHWAFTDRAELLGHLPAVVNLVAARSASPVVLHAGAVRRPDGRVVLCPGPSNTGKSTLVAALVGAGCDYLGDESIGLRPGSLAAVAYPKPLTVDGGSQAVLGLAPGDLPHRSVREVRERAVALTGDVGRVAAVVFVAFDPGAEVVVRELAPPDALRALLANALNLGRAGDDGLGALCAVAEEVPAVEIRHGDVHAVVERLTHGDLPPAPVPGV